MGSLGEGSGMDCFVIGSYLSTSPGFHTGKCGRFLSVFLGGGGGGRTKF